MAMTHRFFLLALLLASLVAAAQTGVDPNLQSAVAAGNQAWMDGMRSGNAGIIAGVYASDAVLCSAEGQCVFGASAIEQQMRSLLASRGRALSANISTTRLERDRNLAYEWGVAQADFGGGRALRVRYLTVWELQPGGAWKILRDIDLPWQGREGRRERYAGAPAPAEQSSTVRCESGDMGRHSCTAPAEIIRAEVLRQISGSPCTKDRTWGWQGNSIWVDRGCRAEFTVYAYASTPPPANQGVTEYNEAAQVRTLRCESDSMNYKFCAAEGTVRGARLVRQVSGSPCTETQTWGWRSDGIWVDKGCRADFEVTIQ
jgi:uncharacterized protein (TIGR02246 family)